MEAATSAAAEQWRVTRVACRSGLSGIFFAPWLSGIGFHAFVLRYPLMTDHRFPAPLESSRAALEWIRSGEPVQWILDGRMELREELSPARNIDADTCPTFLWATAEDPPGFPNALAHARALFDASIPVELHIYPRGWHGLGLANGVAYGAHGAIDIPHTARWAQACEAWLGAEGFLPAG